MAFHVRDPETDRVVRELARRRGTSLTRAIRDACARELDKRAAELPLAERLKPFWDELDKYPRTGLKADKAFYDSLNDEEDN